ncbi:MAG: hypothetical protein H0W09_02495 [Solirubrobacterales bacterium]|nr:hypothetical protein [Solirubrobacterales bacterium]
MPRKIKTLDESALGFSWTIDEAYERGSHALADGGRVWIVDPVDFDGLDEKLRALGEPAAVLQLLDRHDRDCAEVAERLGVPHHNIPDELPDSPFEVIKVIQLPVWKERALWWADRQALIVAEVVGTNSLYTAGQGGIGMHIFLRPRPPKVLRGRSPQHLLMGHGDPLHGPEATDGLEYAYAHARKDLIKAWRNAPASVRD